MSARGKVLQGNDFLRKGNSPNQYSLERRREPSFDMNFRMLAEENFTTSNANKKTKAEAELANARISLSRVTNAVINTLSPLLTSRSSVNNVPDYLRPNQRPSKNKTSFSGQTRFYTPPSTPPRTSPSSSTNGGYNSRKYKKPTVFANKPKKATILAKKPKKPTILAKKPKKATILAKKPKKAKKVKAKNNNL
jgi:hypothetical protein